MEEKNNYQHRTRTVLNSEHRREHNHELFFVSRASEHKTQPNTQPVPNETHVFRTLDDTATTTIALGPNCGHAVAHCSPHIPCAMNDSVRVSLPPEAHCSKTEMNYVFGCCCCCSRCRRLLSQPTALLCTRSSHSVVLMCSSFHLLFMLLCLHFFHIAFNFDFVDIYAYLIGFNGQQKASNAFNKFIIKSNCDEYTNIAAMAR